MTPLLVDLRKRLGRLADLPFRAARKLLPPRRGPVILMYHRVANERWDPWGLAVKPGHFVEQMEWLARNREILPLAEFARKHRDRTLSRRALAITFDDGYACNAEVAAPLLNRMGLPATIFLPAALIERGGEFWWHELERIVLGHEGQHLTLDGNRVELGERQTADGEWLPDSPPKTPRQRGYLQLWELIHVKGPAGVEAALDELRGQAGTGPAEASSSRAMTVEEVRAARSSAIDYGSHALTHSSLPALSKGEKAHEIRESVLRCEALTGTRPQSFAYPFGDIDRESKGLVEQAGFACACTAAQRPVSRSSSAFALPRMKPGDWPANRLARMLLS